MTAARLASNASSQSVKNASGFSATPSRDNSSYATTFRTFTPPIELTLLYGLLIRPKLIAGDHHAVPVRMLDRHECRSTFARSRPIGQSVRVRKGGASHVMAGSGRGLGRACGRLGIAHRSVDD